MPKPPVQFLVDSFIYREYLGEGDYNQPIPGGQNLVEYYDGIKDVQLNFEIAMKSKDGHRIEQTLWLISDSLERVSDVASSDGSFEFNNLTITSKPFINDADEQGWFVFLLDFQTKLTTFEGENK